jgi:hypothetical protein
MAPKLTPEQLEKQTKHILFQYHMGEFEFRDAVLAIVQLNTEAQ